MLDAIIISVLTLIIAGIGFNSVDLLPVPVLHSVTNINALRWVTAGFSAIIGAALGLLVQIAYRRLEAQVRKMPLQVLITRTIGLILGLLIANLFLVPVFFLPFPRDLAFIKPLVTILSAVLFSYLGVSLADTHGSTFLRLIQPNSVETMLVVDGTLKPASTKVLDTSSIIDGRIEELLRAACVEGQVIIPQFVLAELQQLADGANDMKRVRGRRGLDILNRMKTTYSDRIIIHSADYEDLTNVDTKLVRFTLEINGTLVTNDYNLTKVATLQKVPVLNINDLAQAMKPIYLPGDRLNLKILKEGKEPAQGVGYLDDGTMVVVEEASNHVGGELKVVVTSALQTSAGRMIFAKPNGNYIATN